RNEFASFFDAHDLGSIPDPNDDATFETAKLDWAAAARGEHAAAANRYRQLLRLRHEVLTPRLPALRGEGRMLGDRALTASWPLRDGSRLSLVANFGDELADMDA